MINSFVYQALDPTLECARLRLRTMLSSILFPQCDSTGRTGFGAVHLRATDNTKEDKWLV